MRYFKNTEAGENLADAADEYRAEGKYMPAMDQMIEKFLTNLRSEDIEIKLTSNYFKGVQLKDHYGQVSFLNVTTIENR